MSRLWRCAVLVLVLAAVGLSAGSGTAAPRERTGEAPNGGRLPSQPDFQRNGDTTFRFLPGRGMYEIKQEGRPPSFAQAEPKLRPPAPAKGVADVYGPRIEMPAYEDDPVCRTSGARVVPVYSHRPGGTALTPEKAAFIRQMIKRINWKLVQQSSTTARTVQLKVDCTAGGEIKVSEATTPSQVLSSLRVNLPGQVYGEPSGKNAVKYLVYEEGEEGGTAGISEWRFDAAKEANNSNNTLTTTTVVYACCQKTFVALHELTHALGASQGEASPAAPYSTPGAHCWDGVDILCYGDGTGHNYEETHCPLAEGDGVGVQLDCHKDTYFNTSEPKTGWLSEYWNVGGAEDQFLWAPAKAETRSATEVTASSLNLGAKVNGEGEAISYYFEYGATSSYGQKTAEYNISLEEFGPQDVVVPLTGLARGQIVHYRVKATPATGATIAGADRVATTAWSVDASEAPAGATGDWLNDVSCVASSTCVAVGGAVSVEMLAAEKWNGSKWTLATPPKTEALDGDLSGVSCTSASFCMAVGFLKDNAGAYRPIGLTWNGAKWAETKVVPSLPAGYTNIFKDVACTASNSCEAVGYSVVSPGGGGGPTKTLAAHWDGTDWAVVTSANPEGPEGGVADNQLEGVSCASATVCMAVGRQFALVKGAWRYRPLIERLSGTWVSQAPSVAYAEGKSQTDMWLYGVSCPSNSSCFAVGASSAGSPGPNPKIPFMQRWNGSSWSNSLAPSAPEGPDQALAVSCASPSDCRAVGAGPSALRWTGSGEWRVEAPSAPYDAAFSTSPKLNGISCLTIACRAVGAYNRLEAAGSARLALGWSGAGVAPTATTSTAAGVTETAATLRGFVNPNGVDTNYYFEYGPTTSYGTKTAVTSAGSGLSSIEASVPISGLALGTTYHYRVVATNDATMVNGSDGTFETKGNLAPILANMPVTEAFNGSTTPVSDFATKWAASSWVGGSKGQNLVSGWTPVGATANGAYFAPTVTDTGAGIGAVATMAAGPGASGRFSLWLDMPSPGTAKSGYELRLLSTGTNLYTVSLVKWVTGVETTLASKGGYSFVSGNSLAVADKGSTVAVWTNTGAGFVQLLSAADSTYAGGNAGVEATGASTRLTKFKVGPLAEKVASVSAALNGVAVTDLLSRTEIPLSLGGAWAALAWDTGSAGFKTGWVEPLGWTPIEPFPSVAGAYWQKATVGDTGAGDTVIATLTSSSLPLGRYFSLWLNAPNPAAVKSGYELRVTSEASGLGVKLTKWVSGVATTLASKSSLFYSSGSRFALVDKSGTVSAWSSTGVGVPFTQVLTAADATYSYGYGGIEGTGTARLGEFKLGPLAPQ